MTLVPGGFIMGKSDDDVVNTRRPTKTVTVRSFYMDETEITNSEYRQFVDWVKDSTMRMELAKLMDLVETWYSGSIGDFAFNDSDPEKMTATTNICMITITVSVQMMIPILEEDLIKCVN
jgi:formylglycine-generating enzyme required for sulfatase activity